MEPCQKQLDADCFRHNPAWAKRALAYRLLHLLTPRQLTRRLPSSLRLALIAPGVAIPPGLVLPDGTLVGPGTTLPPTWSPGDPVPPGITIVPGTTFPPGWTPGDPVPDGITMDPGATFPPGWTPGDPVPEGVTLQPGATFPPGWNPPDPVPDGVGVAPGAEFPAGWNPPDPLPEGLSPPPVLPPAVVATGPAPPTYVAPGAPGPLRPPVAPPPAAVTTIYLEPFDTLEAGGWEVIDSDGAETTITAGILKQTSPDGVGHAAYRLITSFTWPTNFTFVWRMALIHFNTEPGIQIRANGIQFHLYLSMDDQIWLDAEAGWILQDIPGSFDAEFHTYKMVVLGDHCQILMDDVEIIASCEMPTTAFDNHIYIRLSHNSGDSETQYEYCQVTEP